MAKKKEAGATPRQYDAAIKDEAVRRGRVTFERAVHFAREFLAKLARQHQRRSADFLVTPTTSPKRARLFCRGRRR